MRKKTTLNQPAWVEFLPARVSPDLKIPSGEGTPKFRFTFDAKKCQKIAPAKREDLFEKYENFGCILTVDTLASGQVQERNSEIESLTRIETPKMGKYAKDEDPGCCLLL